MMSKIVDLHPSGIPEIRDKIQYLALAVNKLAGIISEFCDPDEDLDTFDEIDEIIDVCNLIIDNEEDFFIES